MERKSLSRTEEAYQKEAVAAGRLGTHRGVLREYGKDERPESRLVERVQSKRVHHDPSAVASPERNRPMQ
jgi:hypothetical protein